MTPDRIGLNDRVCVVGGGAAGLAAARYLVGAGCTKVSVLEEGSRVGGKCFSVEIDSRAFDLGAIILNSGYRRVLEIARVLDVRLTSMPDVFVADTEAGEQWRLGDRLPGGRFEVAASLARYMVEMARLRRVFSPGFGHRVPELAQPFRGWLDERGLGLVGDIIAPYFTAFGYGYLSEVPALYPFKFFDWSKLAMLAGFALGRRPPRWRFDAGFQKFWEKAARGLDTRLNSKVRSIQRRDGVVLETEVGVMEADWLVLACPPSEVQRIVDVAADEDDLLSQIKYVDYRVFLAEIDGLAFRSCFLENHLRAGTEGHLMVVTRPWVESNIHVLYAMGDGNEDDADLLAQIGEDVAALGGRMGQVRFRKRWSKYFPHVRSRDIASGHYEKLGELQGQRRTLYVGEHVAFGAVEPIVVHAEHLMGRALGR